MQCETMLDFTVCSAPNYLTCHFFKRQPAWLDASSGGASVCLFFFARDFMSNAFADFNQSLKEVYDAYFGQV